MAYGLIHRLRVDSGIEAVVNVQANPGVTVTLIGSDKTTMFTAVADSTTGLAAIAVNIPDTYTIGTDISTDSFAEGNTPSIDISESKTYTAQFIKLNKGYTECGCTNSYKSNSLLIWWNGTKPTEYFSGWYCIDTEDNSETTGEGEVYQISSSISYRGFLKDVASGTTKTYKIGAYVTINGKNYYSAAETVTGTSKTFEASTKVYTASTTATVPDGCHSITAFVVGGGGGGGRGGYVYIGEYSSTFTRCCGGGGGGGGRQTSKTVNVTPGQSISIVIGSGGNGGSGGYRSGSYNYSYSENGNSGGNGGTSTVNANGVAVSASGGNGGGGGSVHFYVSSEKPQADLQGGSGGSGYRNGGNGGSGPGANGSNGGSSNNGYSAGGGGSPGSFHSDNGGTSQTGSNGSGGGSGAGSGSLSNGGNASANTGSGGGASTGASSGSGGSGIVKITFNT